MESVDKTNELGTKNIGQLLWAYALPSVISQIISSVYNIVDRVFLGQYVGALAIAGLAITLPIMNIVHAFGSLVGAGSGARMSIVLGRKDIRWAEKILGNSVILTFLFGFFFVSLTYIFMDDILSAFGASSDTIAYAREYMNIVMPGMFLTTLTFNLTGLIRASGYPAKSMWIMVGGAALNIVLDAILIVIFDFGIAGAAWATTISMAISSVFAICHFIPRRKAAFIRFKKHCWAPKLYIFRNILAIGISPFSMNLAASGVAVIINHQLIKYGGDLAVGTYGIINSTCLIIVLLLLGICQGMQPIAGYNYGANKNDRLKETYTLTMKVCLSVGIIGTLICCLLPQPIIRCFTSDSELLQMGIPAIRFMTIMMPIIAFTIVNSQFFQSIDKPWIAIVTSLSRQVIFLIPMMFIVPIIFEGLGGSGLTGVWCSCTISDVLGGVLAAALLYSQRKVFRQGYIAPERNAPTEFGPED
ncbi:MAG: MATE family efflux transporter [Bacteroidales bacterium]|nr:MATE family efflux transporter [Bacteroidales bacterium]